MGQTPSDRVFIKGLKCQARVGVTEAERRQPQDLLVDITFPLSLAKAGQHDDFNATVDYAAASALAQQVAAAKPYNLVEAVGEAIAAALLKQFPLITTVELCLHKFSVPGAEFVGVAITRDR